MTGEIQQFMHFHANTRSGSSCAGAERCERRRLHDNVCVTHCGTEAPQWAACWSSC